MSREEQIDEKDGTNLSSCCSKEWGMGVYNGCANYRILLEGGNGVKQNRFISSPQVAVSHRSSLSLVGVHHIPQT
jgi:hypothetical protein